MLDCADKEQNKNEEKKRQRKIRRMPNQLKQTNKLERRESIKWSCWQKKETQRNGESVKEGDRNRKGNGPQRPLKNPPSTLKHTLGNLTLQLGLDFLKTL